MSIHKKVVIPLSLLGALGAVATITITEKPRKLEAVIEPCLYQLHQQRLKDCNPTLSKEKGKRFYQLQIAPDQVCFPQDTEKPNALLIYPLNDHNGTFYSGAQRNFVDDILSRYDSTVIIAEKYDEVNVALGRANAIDLLIISGHGSEDGIQLGEKYQSYSDGMDKAILHDFQLKAETLDKALQSDATIFLNSCSQGLYFQFFIPYHLQRQRTVISSYRDFSISDVQVREWYPLRLKITVDKDDVTKTGPPSFY